MKTKLAILIGAILSFSAYAENQIVTLEDGFENNYCGDRVGDCVLEGSKNTVVIKKTGYGEIIGGIYNDVGVSDETPVSIIDNTVKLLAKNDTLIFGTVANVDTNRNVEVSGNVIVNSEASGSITGAFLNKNIRQCAGAPLSCM